MFFKLYSSTLEVGYAPLRYFYVLKGSFVYFEDFLLSSQVAFELITYKKFLSDFHASKWSFKHEEKVIFETSIKW